MSFLTDWLPEIPAPNGTWESFTVVLFALISFIWVVARLVTRVTEDSDPAETDRQMLTAINDLQRKGDLSQEEFRSIKGQLIERLHDDPNSSTPDSSDHGGPIDSAGGTVAASVSVTNEIGDTIVDSMTRPDLTALPDSSPSEEDDQSDGSEQDHQP